MADIIRLLPDGVINQIAAGEVIQRPASVVKELIDNALDSGASDIKLLIRDAGKTLIQIHDNGCGMSPTDARMAFERHATSKILNADDLFKIQTKGFRGEALASIASVAQVELKTKPHDHVTGTRIVITESKIKNQEPCACNPGTQIQVKNLFFNVPARRKFLKSDSIELRHIVDEFIYQAVSFPEISFSLQINDEIKYKLTPSNLKQRIIAVFGKKYQEALLVVQPQSDVLEISGFIGKPEIARKTRGEQYLFVNRRAIRSSYLQHAVQAAYDQILQDDTYPFYVLFLNIDPEKIDINVHPTKNEIKFEEDKLVYQFLKAAVRYSLSQYSFTPMIDFDSANPGIDRALTGEFQHVMASGFSPIAENSKNIRWDQVAFPSEDPEATEQTQIIDSRMNSDPGVQNLELGEVASSFKAYQYLSSYIIVQLNTGITIIDQHLASERILYEYYKQRIQSKSRLTQKLLFPQTLHLTTQDAALLNEILEPLSYAGFEIEAFGSNSFVIHGIPAEIKIPSIEQLLVENVMEEYKRNQEIQLPFTDHIAQSLASAAALKRNKTLQAEEIEKLVEQLFLCEIPYTSPSGKKCIFHLSIEELQKKFS
ncbi:MAG: DNA mismatch repair endonuclease MutL [Saprospiraceae bacterium]|nr:DNA mismatch repair endonuclease MutL [Saprospiraceae bacterium]